MTGIRTHSPSAPAAGRAGVRMNATSAKTAILYFMIRGCLRSLGGRELQGLASDVNLDCLALTEFAFQDLEAKRIENVLLNGAL